MIVFKFSFLVVVSCAAFAVTQINSRKPKPSSTSPENDELGFQQEQSEDTEKDKFEDSNLETKEEEKEVKRTRSQTKQDLRSNEPESDDVIKYKCPRIKNVNEIEVLKNAVNEMEQRRVTLEVKLLEHYGLNEQKIYISKLRYQLKANTREIEELNLTCDGLNVEREKLREEIKQNGVAERELEVAKRAIWEIQAKAQVDGEQMNGLLATMREQVFGFQQAEEMEFVSGDSKVERKMKERELEVLKMKRRIKEGQLEKRELAIKLDAAEASVNVLSNMTESKLIAAMEGEISSLTLANKKLTKQAETLQKDRFSMVEELVYQRWLNTIMRIEVQNYHSPPENKFDTRIIDNSIVDYLEKFRLLSSDHSFASVSPRDSSSESDRITGTTTDSSPGSKKSAIKRFSLIRKIKRWGSSKDDLSAISSPSTTPRKNLVRRFSESIVPSRTPFWKEKVQDSAVTLFRRGKGQDNTVASFKREKVQGSNGTSCTKDRVQNSNTETTLPRVRRVSFQDMLNSEENAITSHESEDSIVMERSNESGAALTENEATLLVKFDHVSSDDESNKSDQEVSEIARSEELPSGVSDVVLCESKVEGQMWNLIVAVLLFFLLMSLVYYIGLP